MSARPTLGRRLTIYLFGTVAVCVMAAVIGVSFFPAELRTDTGEVLRGDSGENEFAWLAGVDWALGALVICVVAAVAYEVYTRSRDRPSNPDDSRSERGRDET